MTSGRVTAVTRGAAALAAALTLVGASSAGPGGGGVTAAVAISRGKPFVGDRRASVARAPAVRQLVVFRDGTAVTKRTRAAAADVRAGGRRCLAPAGTALAALARSHVGALGLHDYGACSTRARDSAGLFIRSIRGERNRGVNGWVYKVGTKSASAGAADPAGPFGSGRLRSGSSVTWFYCRMQDDGCQRTLTVKATRTGATLVVRVTGYDDRGDGVAVDGATVHAGTTEATTGADGTVTVAAAGPTRVWAEKDGLVRSFTENIP